MTAITLVNSLAPFPAGTQVLLRERPWDGAWTVTGCRRDPRCGWIVEIKWGTITGTGAPEDFMLAPSDWTDPPIRPQFRRYYELKELFGPAPIRDQADDADFQAEMRRYWIDYAAWCDHHVAPLGFAEEAARARSLAASYERTAPQ